MAKKKSRSADETSSATDGAAAAVVEREAAVADRFIGQWNRLVSTTNWEKGRIICQWRDALIAAGEPVTAYSDEAWAQLVGGVTSQHVGRLRRAFQRFGDTFDQYEGLYWSHFQAAIDWEDAEMWLEGAIRGDWSVSQMRGKRWETLGLPGEAPTDEVPFDEVAEDGSSTNEGASAGASSEALAPESSAVNAPSKSKSVDDDADEDTESEDASAESDDDEEETSTQAPAKSRTRLAVDVDDLPADLADAFEQFKLAIIAHRRDGWSETTPAAVVECLDALRTLAEAPLES